MVLDGALGEPCGKWRRLSRSERLCPQNPHIPMFVTAPVLKFPSVVMEQVPPATVLEYVCDRIRGHVCTCFSRCRAAPTVFPTATVPISRLWQVPTEQTAQHTAEILQVRLLDQVVFMPLCCVQTVQPVEIPQLQFLDTDDMLVVALDRGSGPDVQKTVRCRSCRSSSINACPSLYNDRC